MPAGVERSVPRQAAFVFVFVTVLLDMLALGIILPVLPSLVVRFLSGDATRAAEIYGVFGTAWALMQFVFSPVLGALSDRFGRRPVILISNFGLGLDYILMALAPNLVWLFVGRLVSGITAASISTSFAYIADVTPPEQRGAKFGMLGAAFGAGFVIGPALGGLLAGFDLRAPFWVAAALSLANAFYGLFILPESLPPERRTAFSWKNANPLGALLLLRSEPGLLGLATSNFLGHLAHAVLPSVAVLYMTFRYGFSESVVGLTLAGVGVGAVVVQAGLVGRAISLLGERGTLMAGLAFGAVGFAIYGLATSGPVFWSAIPVMAFWGLASPAAQGLMSRRISPSAQGRLQGANSSMMSLAALIGPGLFTQTYARAFGPNAVVDLPGLPFLLASLLLVMAGVVAWRAAAGDGPGGNVSPARET